MKNKQTLQKIFLSYSKTDAIYARDIRNILLQKSNINIFSNEMLSAGEDWETKLKDELKRCDFFVVILSPKSINSNWILHELGAAWALGKQIIPIVTHRELMKQMPLLLRDMNALTINDLKDPNKVKQMLNEVETELI